MTSDHHEEPDLAESIERYLDGDLSADERRVLELRLEEDAAARSLFNEALATRALVELALSDEQGAEGKPCLRARALVPDYHHGRLGAAETAELVRHLDRCRSCAGWYDGFARARPHRSGSRGRWVAVTAGTVMILLTVLVTDWVTRNDTPPAEDARARAHPVFSRAVVPLDRRDCMDVVTAISERLTPSGFERAYEIIPGWIDALLDEPATADWLEHLGLSRAAMAQRREVAFLLAFGLARNLEFDGRRVALQHLSHVAGVRSRTLFEALAKSTRSDEEFHLAAFIVLSEDVEHPRHVRSLTTMWEIADDRGFRGPLATLLDAMAVSDHPMLVRRCREVLEGHYGNFRGVRFPAAATILIQYATDHDAPEARAMVEDCAVRGTLGAGRGRCITALATSTSDSQWVTAARRLHEDSDPEVRLIYLRWLEDHPDQLDRPVLRRLAADADERVRDRALADMAILGVDGK